MTETAFIEFQVVIPIQLVKRARKLRQDEPSSVIRGGKTTCAPSHYRRWKNVIERAFALLALAILTPLLALVALAVRLDSPGSPVFCQERVGKDGRRFNLYKFRSMYKNKDDSRHREFLQRFVRDNITSRLDENGSDIFQLIRDPRVTRIGTVLRRTGLDELLQLVNVLKGDMALIGPRPDIPFTVEMYQKHHYRRLRVKPGITGLWQVSGRRSLSFEDMVRLDLEYIDRESPLLDAKILLLTAREVLLRDNR